MLGHETSVAQEGAAGSRVANAPHDDDVFRNGKSNIRGDVAMQSGSHEYELLIVGRPGLSCQLAIRHINFLTTACASESASPAMLKEVIR